MTIEARRVDTQDYQRANLRPPRLREFMRFRGDVLNRMQGIQLPVELSEYAWQRVVPHDCELCASGRFVLLDDFAEEVYGPIRACHVAVAALQDFAEPPPAYFRREAEDPRFLAYLEQIDRNRRQNLHSRYHRTRRRGSPMAQVVCLANSEWGWRYWSPERRCWGSLALDGAGEPCYPDSPSAARWCLAGWLGRYRKPKEALQLLEQLWGMFPESLKEEIDDWCDPAEKRDAWAKLATHPISLWWEATAETNGRWVEKVFRLGEGPFA